MKTKTYKFTIPDYESFSNTQLHDEAINVMEKLKGALGGFNNKNVHKVASLFTHLRFIVIELTKRHPEFMEQLSVETELESYLYNLKININEEEH